MELIGKNGFIDRLATSYPSAALRIQNEKKIALPISFYTFYGYSHGTGEIRVGAETWPLLKGQFFSLPIQTEEVVVAPETWVFAAIRVGFQGQKIPAGFIEKTGRLTYIDGCSDSLLIYPPRLGDPSLNYLYFPEQTSQSPHTHPSIRLGCVVHGSGFADLKSGQLALTEGDIFCLDPQERHRFLTTQSDMGIVVYHPDGDWGPTDHNHTMLNRTYLQE